MTDITPKQEDIAASNDSDIGMNTSENQMPTASRPEHHLGSANPQPTTESTSTPSVTSVFVKQEPVELDGSTTQTTDSKDQTNGATAATLPTTTSPPPTTAESATDATNPLSAPNAPQFTPNDQHPPSSSTSNANPTPMSTSILEAIDEFDSSIPDAVVHHFLNVAGMQTSDPRIIKLIAIAAQKFVHDVVSDSLQHCKLRGAQGKKTKEKKFVLTIEDLASALSEYGIEVKRQQYFN